MLKLPEVSRSVPHTKRIIMVKKELTFLIVFLLSLPACCGWSKKSKSECPKTKKMAQRTDLFSQVNIPLAEDTILEADDASVRSFFDDDMQDFMTFAQDADDFELDQAGERGADEYSWLNEEEQKKKLKTAYFDFDRHNVRSDERKKAKENADKVKKLVEVDKNTTIVVEGHACASAGSAAYNLALSEKRAKSYADFLEANGVPSDRIKKVGRGKEMLVLKEGSREEQWVNRRVELHPVHDVVVS